MSIDPRLVALRRARIAERRRLFPTEIEAFRAKRLRKLEEEIAKMTARHERDVAWREETIDQFGPCRNEIVFLGVLDGKSYAEVGRQVGLGGQRVARIYQELYWRFPPESDEAPIPEPLPGVEIPE